MAAMTGLRWLVLSLLALLVAAVPSVAYAESAAQVAAGLRSGPVYQSAGVDLIDTGAVAAELSGTSPQVYVAVLAAGAAATARQADDLATSVGAAVGDSDAVVLVITASRHLGAGQGSAAAARGVDADRALADELATDRGGFTKDNVTAFALSFAQRISAQASTGGDLGAPSDPGSSGGSTGPSALPVFLVLLAALGGGAALVVRSGRKRRDRLNEGLRAEVEQLYNRLANDVLTLDARDNEVAKQSLADAGERYNATGAALATADSPAEFAAARRSAVEGLSAARAARTALGLDPGPEVPVAYGGGPQLSADRQVQFGGQTYEGSPSYQPGRPHYFGGGTVGGQPVPGGWYSGRFWEPFLLGSILTGGMGGMGGGYVPEHDRDDDHRNGGGGDWGGASGGGDWGGASGGGGDWGGSGAGGAGGGNGGGGGGSW